MTSNAKDFNVKKHISNNSSSQDDVENPEQKWQKRMKKRENLQRQDWRWEGRPAYYDLTLAAARNVDVLHDIHSRDAKIIEEMENALSSWNYYAGKTDSSHDYIEPPNPTSVVPKARVGVLDDQRDDPDDSAGYNERAAEAALANQVSVADCLLIKQKLRRDRLAKANIDNPVGNRTDGRLFTPERKSLSVMSEATIPSHKQTPSRSSEKRPPIATPPSGSPKLRTSLRKPALSPINRSKSAITMTHLLSPKRPISHESDSVENPASGSHEISGNDCKSSPITTTTNKHSACTINDTNSGPIEVEPERVVDMQVHVENGIGEMTLDVPSSPTAADSDSVNKLGVVQGSLKVGWVRRYNQMRQHRRLAAKAAAEQPMESDTACKDADPPKIAASPLLEAPGDGPERLEEGDIAIVQAEDGIKVVAPVSLRKSRIGWGDLDVISTHSENAAYNKDSQGSKDEPTGLSQHAEQGKPVETNEFPVEKDLARGKSSRALYGPKTETELDRRKPPSARLGSLGEDPEADMWDLPELPNANRNHLSWEKTKELHRQALQKYQMQLEKEKLKADSLLASVGSNPVDNGLLLLASHRATPKRAKSANQTTKEMIKESSTSVQEADVSSRPASHRPATSEKIRHEMHRYSSIHTEDSPTSQMMTPTPSISNKSIDAYAFSSSLDNMKDRLDAEEKKTTDLPKRASVNNQTKKKKKSKKISTSSKLSSAPEQAVSKNGKSKAQKSKTNKDCQEDFVAEVVDEDDSEWFQRIMGERLRLREQEKRKNKAGNGVSDRGVVSSNEPRAHHDRDKARDKAYSLMPPQTGIADRDMAVNSTPGAADGDESDESLFLSNSDCESSESSASPNYHVVEDMDAGIVDDMDNAIGHQDDKDRDLETLPHAANHNPDLINEGNCFPSIDAPVVGAGNNGSQSDPVIGVPSVMLQSLIQNDDLPSELEEEGQPLGFFDTSTSTALKGRFKIQEARLFLSSSIQTTRDPANTAVTILSGVRRPSSATNGAGNAAGPSSSGLEPIALLFDRSSFTERKAMEWWDNNKRRILAATS